MPRSHAAAHIGDRMKLHRRRLRLAGRDYTVITLRPGTDARFSTNFFHQTWHVVSDWRGARVLGRLLWGLAYQRVPGTLVLVDRPFLDANPFDAEPADPIALVPARLTPWDARAARELRRRLPLTGPPDGTVRWHTPGLAPAVAQRRAEDMRPYNEERPPWIPERGFQRRVDRIGGVLTLLGAPDALREDAVGVYRLGDCAFRGMDYIDFNSWEGEVQVFCDYRRRVTAARIARREVLGRPSHPRDPDALRPLVWQRGTEVREALALRAESARPG